MLDVLISMQNVLRLPVMKAKTGVKHLHKAALQFDIAVYFEANGHGTILFSRDFIKTLHVKQKEYQNVVEQLNSSSERRDEVICGLRSISNLLSLNKMINPSVGDAISGMLLVDLTLKLKQWTTTQWADLYRDLPSRQKKVVVPDRRLIVTNESEEQVIQPVKLQVAIDQCILDMRNEFTDLVDQQSLRCFVRPSGTEDVVRIYAEASDTAVVDVLINRVAAVTEEIMNEFSRKQ